MNMISICIGCIQWDFDLLSIKIFPVLLTIHYSYVHNKSNLKRGNTISVDRISYRVAIVNPRQARPPHCRPTAFTTVAIATMFYLEKPSTTSELKPFMCFKVIYACKRTFESKLCTYTPRYVLLPFLQLGP